MATTAFTVALKVDSVSGNNGNDTVNAGDGNDYIWGGSGSDSLSGDDGDDRINGGSDDDFIDGGNGSDFIGGSLVKIICTVVMAAIPFMAAKILITLLVIVVTILFLERMI